ncbi:MAG TPA: DUF3662 and FHA domain-containing protein [Solirubrobacteraceae bacterium]|jgi:hypothetical protein|nr:DUF3662 and FHA domain-containing protein [Solirubrobacteraceae bacterium]
MNPLRTLENMIAGLVEGTFGRVFKAEVRPMELAHKLAREMDENKTISVSRVYAPNEYSVWLSPRDRARYEGVEQEVIDELCAYLLEHARAEDLALASRPQIVFHTDEDLQLGEFGIEARLARLEEEPPVNEEPPQPAPTGHRASAASAGGAGASIEPAGSAVGARSPAVAPAPAYTEPEEVGNTMIFSNSQRTRAADEQTGARRRPKALLLVSGRRLLVAPRGATIGRSRDCDIVLEDSSISRRHAELRPGGQGWTIEDLGSTNGVRVNGATVHGPQEVHTGDRIEIGSTEMLFEIAP